MDPETAVNEFVRRAVAKDLDGLAELVSDDIEYDNVPMGKNHGPEEFHNVLGAMVGHFDEIDFVIHRQTCSGNVVMNDEPIASGSVRSGSNCPLPVCSK